MTVATSDKPIIFFDGNCGMCNTFVDVILRVDKSATFMFAPLQGKTASEMLPPLDKDPESWSLVYIDEDGTHDQSDASLSIYRRMGGIWSLLSLARFVPKAIRNPIYRIIAKNRYRWFGRRESCRLPTTAEKLRFLP